jgi:uncharacterized protein YicC (UPF0701 family)
MRTTVDIDAPVLKDLKKIRQKEGKSLGRLISDLLAQALSERESAKIPASPPKWISKRMGAGVDLADHEALYAAMENEPPPHQSSKSQ